jgi:hypothetical protein
MTQLMPLKKAVVRVTNEAETEDEESIRKAVKSWHNRLAGGSIPRAVVVKLGRELFLDLDAWERWLEARKKQRCYSGPGRPRTLP